MAMHPVDVRQYGNTLYGNASCGLGMIQLQPSSSLHSQIPVEALEAPDSSVQAKLVYTKTEAVWKTGDLGPEFKFEREL